MFQALLFTLALQGGVTPADTIQVAPDTVYVIHKWEQPDSMVLNPQATLDEKASPTQLVGTLAGLAVMGVGTYLFIDGFTNREVEEIVLRPDGSVKLKKESFNTKMIWGLGLGLSGMFLAISFQ